MVEPIAGVFGALAVVVWNTISSIRLMADLPKAHVISKVESHNQFCVVVREVSP